MNKIFFKTGSPWRNKMKASLDSTKLEKFCIPASKINWFLAEVDVSWEEETDIQHHVTGGVHTVGATSEWNATHELLHG